MRSLRLRTPKAHQNETLGCGETDMCNKVCSQNYKFKKLYKTEV